ncbi:hypothetical protein PCE1_001192 [Barthelona sp. PCE]
MSLRPRRRVKIKGIASPLLQQSNVDYKETFVSLEPLLKQVLSSSANVDEVTGKRAAIPYVDAHRLVFSLCTGGHSEKLYSGLKTILNDHIAGLRDELSEETNHNDLLVTVSAIWLRFEYVTSIVNSICSNLSNWITLKNKTPLLQYAFDLFREFFWQGDVSHILRDQFDSAIEKVRNEGTSIPAHLQVTVQSLLSCGNGRMLLIEFCEKRFLESSYYFYLKTMEVFMVEHTELKTYLSSVKELYSNEVQLVSQVFDHSTTEGVKDVLCDVMFSNAIISVFLDSYTDPYYFLNKDNMSVLLELSSFYNTIDLQQQLFAIFEVVIDEIVQVLSNEQECCGAFRDLILECDVYDSVLTNTPDFLSGIMLIISFVPIFSDFFYKLDEIFGSQKFCQMLTDLDVSMHISARLSMTIDYFLRICTVEDEFLVDLIMKTLHLTKYLTHCGVFFRHMSYLGCLRFSNCRIINHQIEQMVIDFLMDLDRDLCMSYQKLCSNLMSNQIDHYRSTCRIYCFGEVEEVYTLFSEIVVEDFVIDEINDDIDAFLTEFKEENPQKIIFETPLLGSLQLKWNECNLFVTMLQYHIIVHINGLEHALTISQLCESMRLDEKLVISHIEPLIHEGVLLKDGHDLVINRGFGGIESTTDCTKLTIYQLVSSFKQSRELSDKFTESMVTAIVTHLLKMQKKMQINDLSEFLRLRLKPKSMNWYHSNASAVLERLEDRAIITINEETVFYCE